MIYKSDGSGMIEVITADHQGSDISLPSKKSTFSGADLYLMSLRSKNSRRTMKAGLKKIAEVLGYNSYHDVPFENMQSSNIDVLFEKMLTNFDMNPQTVNLYFSAMKGVFKHCWKANLMSHEEYMKILSVKELKGSRINHDKCIVDKCVVTKLIERCTDEGTNIGLRDAAIFAVLAGCGLRREEVANLNLSSYAEQKRKIFVIGKGNKERYSFTPFSTMDALDRWFSVRGCLNGALFTAVHKSDVVSKALLHLSGQTIYDILHKRCDEFGIKNMHPHAIRHYYATQLLRSGTDIVTVRDMMGHKSIATTQTYIDKSESEQLKALEHVEF
jgi:site-specific recombinase XerD